MLFYAANGISIWFLTALSDNSCDCICSSEIFRVNAFIGFYLRMEALLKMKEYKILLNDIEKFFGKMEEYSGTLWEYRDGKGSKDHGFASYVLSVILDSLDAAGEKYQLMNGC